jgi:hypothetical protein
LISEHHDAFGRAAASGVYIFSNSRRYSARPGDLTGLEVRGARAELDDLLLAHPREDGDDDDATDQDRERSRAAPDRLDRGTRKGDELPDAVDAIERA